MRTLAAAAVLAALVAVPAASAKIDLSLRVATHPVRRGRPVVVYLRSGTPLPWNLKLIAVAPGRSWYDVVGTVTGDSQLARARIPRDGFAVRVRRLGPERWRAVVRFPRRGRWRLVIPNEAPHGFMIPPPVIHAVVVR